MPKGLDGSAEWWAFTRSVCENPRMIFSFFRRRRRKALLATPFPEEWVPWLLELPFYQGLDPSERGRLHDILRVIIAEKEWEGCAGFEITDEVQVVIAAQAALLLIGIEHDFFHRVKSILVYPTAYETGRSGSEDGMIVDEDGGTNLGEAWYRGPVVLSWDSVRYGAEDPKDAHNLVLHEFAHKLDMMDGYVDGTPPLTDKKAYREWARVMTEEYEALKGKTKKGKRSVLDRYGATNEAEFFAVAVETFFEKPLQMVKRHGELYKLLRDYFHQDPAERLRRGSVPDPG